MPLGKITSTKLAPKALKAWMCEYICVKCYLASNTGGTLSRRCFCRQCMNVTVTEEQAFVFFRAFNKRLRHENKGEAKAYLQF